MARIKWGKSAGPEYEQGLDRGVLYVGSKPGVAWNGLTAISIRPVGGTPISHWIDGEKFLNSNSLEEIDGSISAYFSPEEFDVCDGSVVMARGVLARQQLSHEFGLSFRTQTESSHKLHLVYNALAKPTSRIHSTMTNSPSAPTLSWSFSTRPLPAVGESPTSYIVVDVDRADAEIYEDLENLLYGTSGSNPRLPSPNEILGMFGVDAMLIVVDHGDGSFSVTGPDDFVKVLANGRFELTSGQIDHEIGGSYVITYTP